MKTGKLGVAAILAVVACFVFALASCAPTPASSTISAQGSGSASAASASASKDQGGPIDPPIQHPETGEWIDAQDYGRMLKEIKAEGLPAVTEADLAPVDVTVAPGDWEGLREVYQQGEKGQLTGKVICVEGISKLVMRDSYCICIDSPDGKHRSVLEYAIDGAEQNMGYPPDGSHIVVTGKMLSDKYGLTHVVHTLPSHVEYIDDGAAAGSQAALSGAGLTLGEDAPFTEDAYWWDANGNGVPERMDVHFVDNGDEAPSLLDLSLRDTTTGAVYEGFIDRGYEIFAAKTAVDDAGACLVVGYYAGDFYQHDFPAWCTVRLVGNELKVEELKVAPAGV